MGSGDKTPCMLDLITRWKLVVNTCSGLFKTMTKNRRYQLEVGKPYRPFYPRKHLGERTLCSF